MEKNTSCQLCGKSNKVETLFPAELVRPAVAAFIKSENPNWNSSGKICMSELTRYRALYLENLMKTEQGETALLENDFQKSLSEAELISENMNKAYDEKLKFGDRLADKIASFGGSWKFIIIFGSVLVFWISINTWLLLHKPFDPYPFILLNLILSCLAAIQAPIIMMSQNRHSEKDRLKSDNEYKVNMKAELEIRHLNEKIDFLLAKQWERLLEIQQFQTDLMQEMINSKENKK
ncbi:MAG: DUF1003 domain-containing protein [Prolixibacteraceae bacterium]